MNQTRPLYMLPTQRGRKSKSLLVVVSHFSYQSQKLGGAGAYLRFVGPFRGRGGRRYCLLSLVRTAAADVVLELSRRFSSCAQLSCACGPCHGCFVCRARTGGGRAYSLIAASYDSDGINKISGLAQSTVTTHSRVSTSLSTSASTTCANLFPLFTSGFLFHWGGGNTERVVHLYLSLPACSRYTRVSYREGGFSCPASLGMKSRATLCWLEARKAMKIWGTHALLPWDKVVRTQVARIRRGV